MVKIAGYMEMRRAGYAAVRDVPPSLRAAVGRNRLRKGLGTRDVHVARARLLPALVELEERIRAACRLHPATDTRTAEALAIREHVVAMRAAGGGEALDLAADAVVARAEVIEEAEGAAAAVAYADLALGRTTPFAHYVEEWLAAPGQRGALRPRTVDDYRRMVTAFETWIAAEGSPATLEAVTRRRSGSYVAHLSASGVGPVRVRTIVSALKGYWQHAERRGALAEGVPCPWDRQAPHKITASGPQEPERAFTDGEVAALLAGPADALLGDLMRLAALSGMRIEEACRLTVAMCAGGVFRAPGTKTDAAKRDVPIHSELAAMVEARCKGRAPVAYLFPELGEPTAYGDRSPAISKRFGRYRQLAGVHERAEGRRRSRVNFHSFRRWFITAALRAGQEKRVVQQVVGHKLQGITEGVYFAGDTLEAKRACVEAVRLASSSS